MCGDLHCLHFGKMDLCLMLRALDAKEAGAAKGAIDREEEGRRWKKKYWFVSHLYSPGSIAIVDF